ncbi:nesprin-2-like isoform X2 [Gouania willdenowi]|uniref:nesprin-2-like isoform X2 n=1 Tax=Gouania willdenowi TaxID=441366 RepID=UPI0010564D21|nr:nesprin-2-like isoform X2 [Gouania willdenowi]
MVSLDTRAKDHETYLNMRQRVEDIMQKIQEQAQQNKDENNDLEKRYTFCQALLIKLPQLKSMSEESETKLQLISTDLYPSQQASEQQRLKEIKESLKTLEVTLNNDLKTTEWDLLKDLDLQLETKATEDFFRGTQVKLQTIPKLDPHKTAITEECQRVEMLKMTLELRIRALEVLQQKKGGTQSQEYQALMELKENVLKDCDSQMEELLKVQESLNNYTHDVEEAARFLRNIENSLLPPQGSTGQCSDSVEVTQQALTSLQQQFQSHVEQLQSRGTMHPFLSPQKVEQLQENILSQLLVRMSTLQAKGHSRLESLNRCAELNRNYTKSQSEIIHSVKMMENKLQQLISQKITCLPDCTEQEEKLRALSEDLQSLIQHLQELKDWCSEQSCRREREAALNAIWRRVSRLPFLLQKLRERSTERIAEWKDVSDNVEKASVLLQQVEANLPDGNRLSESTEDLQEQLQHWEQFQDGADCEHRALSALELRAARLLAIPAHLDKAPPTPLCQQLQAMQERYARVKQSSKEGLQKARVELQEREKLLQELKSVGLRLEAADGLVSEMQQSSSTEELQAVYRQLCNQKALLQCVMERLKMKYSDMNTPIPAEIDDQMKEVTKSLSKVQEKVEKAVEKSGPVHKLGARLSEIQAGLGSVQKRLEEKSPTVVEAKVTQRRVWDELDKWHSRLAALDVDLQDLEKPEDAVVITERLVEVQQQHTLLSKQAEQRTTLISKIHSWRQEHQEMIKSSKSWMAEAQSWLASPCIYTTAKCLSSHVQALKTVLDDSAQIRITLQGFSSPLKEMSQVCDVTDLQEQLVDADRQVAKVQESFTMPLSQLEHAADEVAAIESEVQKMENDMTEIKNLLSAPETLPRPREESLREAEVRIQTMRRTVAEIQRCKPDLCLPEKAEETLTVFTAVDHLQTLLMELEKKVPALFIQQPFSPIQQDAPQLQTSTSEDSEKEEPGQIQIAHVEEDVLRISGAALLTVEQTSPEQRQSWKPESTESTEWEREEAKGRGFMWWLWEAFLGSVPEESSAEASAEPEAASGPSTEETAEDEEDVEGPTDSTEAEGGEEAEGAEEAEVAEEAQEGEPKLLVRTRQTSESPVKTDPKPKSKSKKCVIS